MVTGLTTVMNVLLTLAETPKKFTEIVEDTGLSPATVAKWLQVLEASELITKKENTYEITQGGLGYLKKIMNEIVNTAVNLGLLDRVTHYVDTEPRIIKNNNEYEIRLTAYTQRPDRTYEVIINIGDTTETIQELCNQKQQ